MAVFKSEGSLGALILAAGANTRLKGIVPSYMKPLMLVNGKPLVMHAYDHFRQEWSSTADVTIVVSPDNAGMIAEIVPNHCQLVVQPDSISFIDAISRGMRGFRDDWVVILCADNTFSSLMMTEVEGPVMAVRHDLPPQEAMRFTRFRRDLEAWNGEKRGVKLIPASNVPIACDGIWVGPLILYAAAVRRALEHEPRDIVTLIYEASNGGAELGILPMQCEDFGIPEKLS